MFSMFQMKEARGVILGLLVFYVIEFGDSIQRESRFVKNKLTIRYLWSILKKEHMF